jgi:hypothetical protein
LALLLSWIIFFIAQVFILVELPLTILSIAFSLLLLTKREKGEVMLYFVGFATGLIIEVGLGLIARTQYWEYASFFGVPYWLPFIWGYGFVIMRRVGNSIVAFSQ